MKINRTSFLISLIIVFVLVTVGWAVSRPAGITLAKPNISNKTPTPKIPAVGVPAFLTAAHISGVERLAQIHTELPDRPRFQVMKYTIQKGDTAWSLAQKFHLKIESILWGNEGMSADAGSLRIGQVINILPVDGVLHTVKEDDTLDKLVLLHGTPMEDIVKFPGNGFPEQPPYEIKPGQQIIIPNGQNPVTWQEPGPPVDPTKGRKSGGYYDGPLAGVGTGTFIWPVSPVVITQPYWSGHPAIDIDTYKGQPVFASDSGTVIFADWSKSGYGNLVIIDHGNGYWTYYGHNETILVSVGQGVYQGQQIAESGSTGRSTGDHVDFRIRRDSANFIDPTGFLPKQ